MRRGRRTRNNELKYKLVGLQQAEVVMVDRNQNKQIRLKMMRETDLHPFKIHMRNDR